MKTKLIQINKKELEFQILKHQNLQVHQKYEMHRDKYDKVS